MRYLARGGGYSLFLTERHAVLGLEPNGAGSAAALSIGFPGADPHPALGGVGRLGGRVNYIGGGRPAVGAPTFAGVRYAGLWPGIDARFYGEGGRLEYDFDLAAGADPGRVGLSFAGQRNLRLAPDGSLLVALGQRTIRQPAPQAFQGAGARRRPVASRYVLRGDGRVGIALGAYDRDRPLTIDPRLIYSTYLGRGIHGWATAIAVGADGSAYLTGSTPSSKFPTTTGVFRAKPKHHNAFVTKLSPSGRHIVYSTFLGGAAGADGDAIAVDPEGHAYIAGNAYADDFLTSPGSYRPAHGGKDGAFVVKLGRDGAGLLYSAYIGRRGGETGVAGIAIDGRGSAYVTGMTSSRHFPTTRGAFQPRNPRSRAKLLSFEGTGYVLKLNPAGSKLAYSTFLSGSSRVDLINAIAVDHTGHAYVTGWAQSGDYPTTHGAFGTRLRGPYHEAVLVTKLSPDGSRLTYSTFISGGQNEEGSAIAVDRRDRAYVTGNTESARYPVTPGAYQPERIGSRDIMVSILAPDGRSLEASTYIGAGGPGGLASEASGIGLAPGGKVIVAGYTNSTHFPTSGDALQPRSHNRYYDNSVIAELSPDLGRLLYSTYLAGGSVTHIRGLAVDPAGDAYVAGGSNPGLIQTRGHLPRLHDPRYLTHPNAFVTKLEP